jgi:hypothetical protein
VKSDMESIHQQSSWLCTTIPSKLRRNTSGTRTVSQKRDKDACQIRDSPTHSRCSSTETRWIICVLRRFHLIDTPQEVSDRSGTPEDCSLQVLSIRVSRLPGQSDLNTQINITIDYFWLFSAGGTRDLVKDQLRHHAHPFSQTSAPDTEADIDQQFQWGWCERQKSGPTE